MNAKYLFCRKGKKRSKAAANAENLDSKEILESSFEKEKKVEVEEDEDEENLAAENLFGDPEVRGGGRGGGWQGGAAGCRELLIILFRMTSARPRDVGAL